VLTAQKIQGLVEVHNMEKSSIFKEETSGIRSRGSGEGTSEGLWGGQARIFMKSQRVISIKVLGSRGMRGRGSMQRCFISHKSRVERRKGSQSPISQFDHNR
jgi:hypothetical protein